MKEFLGIYPGNSHVYKKVVSELLEEETIESQTLLISLAGFDQDTKTVSVIIIKDMEDKPARIERFRRGLGLGSLGQKRKAIDSAAVAETAQSEQSARSSKKSKINKITGTMKDHFMRCVKSIATQFNKGDGTSILPQLPYGQYSDIEKFISFFSEIFKRNSVSYIGFDGLVSLFGNEVNLDFRDCLQTSAAEDPSTTSLFNPTASKSRRSFQSTLSGLETITNIIAYLLLLANDPTSPLHKVGKDGNENLMKNNLEFRLIPNLKLILEERDFDVQQFNCIGLNNFAILKLIQVRFA